MKSKKNGPSTVASDKASELAAKFGQDKIQPLDQCAIKIQQSDCLDMNNALNCLSTDSILIETEQPLDQLVKQSLPSILLEERDISRSSSSAPFISKQSERLELNSQPASDSNAGRLLNVTDKVAGFSQKSGGGIQPVLPDQMRTKGQDLILSVSQSKSNNSFFQLAKEANGPSGLKNWNGPKDLGFEFFNGPKINNNSGLQNLNVETLSSQLVGLQVDGQKHTTGREFTTIGGSPSENKI